MTAEKWAALSPRERNLWVWESVLQKRCGSVRCGCSQDGEIEQDVPTYDGRWDPPHYTTDASADYLVLQSVRETWNLRLQRTYSDILDGLIIHRAKLPTGLVFNRCDCRLLYLPGDYSHAAYLALNPEAK